MDADLDLRGPQACSAVPSDICDVWKISAYFDLLEQQPERSEKEWAPK